MAICRLSLALLVVLLSTQSAVAGKQPIGRVTGDQFVDQRYNVQLQKYGNWKFGKIANEDSAKPLHARCILSQKSFTIPVQWDDNEEKFSAPVIGLWVDTTDMVLDAYAAELADPLSRRTSRKDLSRAFPVLQKGDYIQQEPTTIDGQPAILLQFRQPYEVELYKRATNSFKLIEEMLLGDVYVVKRDTEVFVLHFASERAIYRTANEEARKIIMSFDLDPQPDSLQPAPPVDNSGK